jgi:alpha-L-fucosidase
MADLLLRRIARSVPLLLASCQLPGGPGTAGADGPAAAPAALHAEDRHWEAPDDPLVLARLEEWQDLKFGLLMHWGPYSQWGIVESWSICGEDEGWCQRPFDDYEEYRRRYEQLPATFDPRGFEPERWAAAARDAGMGYVVFTTKHHDGFSMFDTRLTDYRITGPGCAFADDPRADVTRGIFDAFRAEGLWAGAYFSKPDWHHEGYWWRRFPTPDRNPNYDLAAHPERWEDYVRFTHGQIEELMTRYGRVDILWLDGGWVQAMSEEEVAAWRARPGWPKQRVQSQDIRMDELVSMARRHQPGLIVVDRAVPGPHQNYLTPENRVPEQLLPYPWESCIISGGGWSHTPGAEYMSVREAVHLLVDVVTKGGNLLLNVAPGPEGRWQDGAYALLAGIGDWMEVNGDAIRGSRPRAPHVAGPVRLLEAKDGTVHAVVLAAGGEGLPPAEVFVPGVAPAPGHEPRLIGGGSVAWRAVEGGILVQDLDSAAGGTGVEHAWILEIPQARRSKD